MTVEEYFRYALKHKLLDDLKFYYTTMTIPLATSNDYYKVDKKQYLVKVDDAYVPITNRTTDEPLFYIKDKITLYNANMSNIPSSVDTTVGKAILNYVLLEHNFGSTIEYMNEPTTIDAIEKVVCDNLKRDKIKVQQYTDFVDACSMLQSLSRITTISATPKTMTPPPGLDKFKKDLKDKYDKEYGKNWVKDELKVIEFGNELKAFDAKYMEDDPTNGKLTSGKVKNNARAKMYLTFGNDAGFSDVGGDSEVVFNSLLEGYPKQKEQLAALFNSSRAGSFARGNETQYGGVVAKCLLRATNNATIEEGDCGSKLYREILVTKDNAASLEGRYMLQGNKPVRIDNPKSFIGKTISIRSPLYCKLSNRTYCSTCCGDQLKDYRKGITALVTNISAVVLAQSMKKMHNAQKELVSVDPIDMIH